MLRRLTFLVCLLLFLLPFSFAEAEVWVLHPDGSGDLPTIQAAIDAAQHSGDIIELTDGVYTGYGNRDLYNTGKSFLIRSQSGNPANCIIDVQGSEDEWHWGIAYDEDGWKDDIALGLQGITITGAYAGSGGAVACYTGQNPEFDNCIFRNNISTYRGGAVSIIESSTRFTNCEFSHNQAFEGGGAVAISNPSDIEFENCVFFENTSEQGGAIDIEHAGPVTLTGCTFSRNHSAAGAHIAVTFGLDDTLMVDHSIMAFGTDAEAVFTDGSSVLTLSCVDIFGNTGGDWTGVIADQETVRGNLSADPFFCGPANPQMALTLTTDSPCAPKNNPGCGLVGAFPVGCGGVAGANDPPAAAADFRLLPCSPNPFNPTTTISFEMDSAADVSVAVYDVSGELVRTLVGGFYPAGTNRTVWQGKNSHGQAVASGVYFVRLNVGRTFVVQKMILLR